MNFKKEDKSHLEKYENLVRKLIQKNFPTLKNKKIKIIENKNINSTADAKRFPFSLRIRTHFRMRNNSVNKLIGIFSHELSHLEYFLTFNWFYYEIVRDFKLWSKKYVKKEEKIADVNAIKKGYARQLYVQRKSRWNIDDKDVINNKWKYLSPDEIKAIAIELNKW